MLKALLQIIIIIIVTPIALTAQVSTLFYWQEPLIGRQNSEWSSSLKTVELSYWMRLKTKRMEFYPGIILGLNKAQGWKRVGAGLDLQVYPFDFRNDCKCPSFSKKYNFFKKGLFMLAGSGILGHLKSADNPKIFPHFRAGFGQDIGLNNFLTISPLITAQYQNGPASKEEHIYMQVMLRLIFRWDRKNF